MQTVYLEITVPRFVLTRLLGRFSPRAYFGPTAPLHLARLPDPPLPAPGWVRVRNRMCGVCGSDLHQIFLDASLDVAPAALPSHQRTYLGHEMVGEIVEVNGDGGDLAVRFLIDAGSPDHTTGMRSHSRGAVSLAGRNRSRLRRPARFHD